MIADVGPHAIAMGSVAIAIGVALALLIYRRPTLTARGALVFATSWVVVGLLAVNAPMVEGGWWEFVGDEPMILSMSTPLLIAWGLLWGVAAPLLGLRTTPTVALLGTFDVAVMPMLDPLVVLGPRWLLGEAILLAVVAAPAVYLARVHAVSSPDTVHIRLLAQTALCCVAVFWVGPGLVLGGLALPNVPPIALGGAAAAVLIGVVPGAISIVEFGLHGGSPWPWDRTTRPIRSGPYRFVRCPMQMSIVATVIVVGALHTSGLLAATALLPLCWAAWFTTNEKAHLNDRWGDSWAVPALALRRWVPQWRPHAAGEHAVLWVDLGCTGCSSVQRFFDRRQTVGLTVRDARDHPAYVNRLRYERSDGVELAGVAAFGAGLEHTNLALAMIGWLLRLPVASQLLQLVADANGLGPRPVSRRGVAAPSSGRL